MKAKHEVKQEVPKPVAFKMEKGLKLTEFDAEELRKFVLSTDLPAFIATDQHGNESVILVAPLRVFFSR
jgi:hypothetical protein